MEEEFIPDNPIEERLLAVYRKEIGLDEFLEFLVNEQVIILSDRDVNISGPDMRFNPLAISSPLGFDALAAFTSIGRAQKAASRYPGYPFAVAVDTAWFLQGAYENAGFALNPGWPYGFEIPPQGLQAMLRRFGLGKKGGST